MVSRLLFLLLCAGLCKGVDLRGLKLKQVLILSRHNVRYPLGTKLDTYSPKIWPKLEGQRGYLTPKGKRLEGYMGEYFSEWFKQQRFVSNDCPDESIVYVYSNTINRTIETAKAFVQSAFKDCNVIVHHQDTKEEDPLFKPVIHNTTEAFKDMVYEEIYRKLRNSKLNSAFAEMNRILDIKNSDICKKDFICDLNEAKNIIEYEVGKQVWVEGPLFIGNSAVDNFLMSYYDGFPLKDVAWGEITTPEKWKLVTEIGRQDQFIRYSTLAQDYAAPLVKYLTKVFKNYDEMPKLIVLVGHDYNLNTVSTYLRFKPFRLPNHFELFPIGGKLVFQRWTDNKNDYLKIEYVYASFSQVRNEAKLSMENPPQRVPMQLTWCKTDRYGFCPWNEFVNKFDLF